MSENRLFDAFLHGDPEGIWPIYFVCKGPLIVFGLRFLDKPADVEEAVASAFLLLREHLGRFDKPEDVRKWLYITVRNLCWNTRRKLPPVTPGLLEEDRYPSDLTAHEALDREDAEIMLRRIIHLINEKLDQLPPKRRHDFSARYFQLKSFQEIAKERGVSPTSVRENVDLALKEIRNYLKFKGLNL